MGMVAPPVPPVKAPSSKSCSSLTKPFPFRSFGKSNATSILLDFAADRANSFTLISLTDPHPLNSVVSYRYKNSGGRASSGATTTHPDFIADSSNSFPLNLFADLHSLNPVVSILYKNTGGKAWSVIPD